MPEPLEQLYSFSEAAKLIPSERGGTVSVDTLHRWRKVGLLQAICRHGQKRDSWFLTHSEVLRLRGEPAEAVVSANVSGPERRKREIEQALADCRAF